MAGCSSPTSVGDTTRVQVGMGSQTGVASGIPLTVSPVKVDASDVAFLVWTPSDVRLDFVDLLSRSKVEVSSRPWPQAEVVDVARANGGWQAELKAKGGNTRPGTVTLSLGEPPGQLSFSWLQPGAAKGDVTRPAG